MRGHLLPALLLLTAAPSLGASGSVTFSGGGYTLEVVVGFEDHPVVAYLLFTPPGGIQATRLPLDQLAIKAFDPQRQILRLQYTNPGQAAQPPSFGLEVRKGGGLLRIGRKRIRGTFDWTL